jgi:hypothetical protein
VSREKISLICLFFGARNTNLMIRRLRKIEGNEDTLAIPKFRRLLQRNAEKRLDEMIARKTAVL